MKGDFHVRFRENVKVKFLCVTRLAVMRGRHSGLTMQKIRVEKLKKMKRNNKKMLSLHLELKML